jgi:hypothetical protein
MRLATIRLSGVGWEPEDAIRAFDAAPDTLWREGDSRTHGRPHEDAGCTFLVSDATCAEQLMLDVGRFLDTHAANVAGFTSRGLRAVLDVGVSVGDSRQFTASLHFTTEVLRALSELQVTLHVAAYPTSDEA